jgi:uncharacterized phage protein (TIGR02218 family)
MKNLAPSLFSALCNEVLTLAYCWQITRTDDEILGFTSFDKDLVIDGVTYQASTGMFATATETNTNLDVNNLNISSFLSSEGISEADLISGVWDFAQVKIFLVNYLDLPEDLETTPYKYILLSEGILGKISNSDRGFSCELRSLMQFLNQKQSWVTSPFCRYELGDDLCTVDLAGYTQALTATGASDNKIIYVEELMTVNYYAYGTITFTSGTMNGRTVRVATNDGYSLTLFESAPYFIELGDTLTAVRGCDKTRETCKSFSNVINFGGEPDLPGVDEYLAGFSDS